MRETTETSDAAVPGRRCHGYCGLPIPADNGTTYTVIGPDGTLREFCDGDCLGTYYLEASREGEGQAHLAGLVRVLEGAARAGPFDVVITRLSGGPWMCELSTISESGGGLGRALVAGEGTGETLREAITEALTAAGGAIARTGEAGG
jgi:hypothetical protein